MQQAPVISPDGYWRWDGTTWVPNTTAPTAAQPPTTSPDGLWMWNGSQWVPNTFRVVVPYASADLRAMLTSVFVGINVIGVLLFIAFDVIDAVYVAQGSPDNGTLSDAEGLTALLAALAYFGSFTVAVVVFCMWLHRVVRNMPSLGATDPTFSPGVAVGLCFVPFVNFVQPLLSVIDAWRGSVADRRWLARHERGSVRTPMIIVGWWAAWIGGRLVTLVGSAMSSSNDSGVVIASAVIDIAGNLLLIGAAGLLILVVRRLTARQDARYRLLASNQLA